MRIVQDIAIGDDLYYNDVLPSTFPKLFILHGKKRRARRSTGLNNVLLPTLFTLVNNIEHYYLFKKFLVSDTWFLTANCEIVIFNSMANQIWIFHIHISKMTSKSQYEKNLDAFAPYYYDDEIILTR